jgi:1-acyl-sn-glycerol-3-phosphate acyltransferase
MSAIWTTVRLYVHILEGVAILVRSRVQADQSDRQGAIVGWARGCLEILNVRITVTGTCCATPYQPVMFVANHVSWLDILGLLSVRSLRFVAKSEVRAWPILGWMAVRIGTIFLDRESLGSLCRARRLLSERLVQGQAVAIFPEGTATVGSRPDVDDRRCY